MLTGFALPATVYRAIADWRFPTMLAEEFGRARLAVRLAQHYKSGLEMARWLATRPEVLRVLHPALESHPGHAIWKRDFTGASGLFSVVLRPVRQQAVDALLATAVANGATLQKPAHEAFWGGYSGYFLDPDGHPWEVAYNPFVAMGPNGELLLPD